jgi:branched-subunit amino acid aminotransferase/4-amino-4-deoxychorismate lyase
VSDPQVIRVEVDGHPAPLPSWATPGYGHFTAMQVRSAATRGLSLHLERLDEANRELFGAGLDGDRVRHHIRHALGDGTDASVRVHAFCPDDEVSVMVTVRPSRDMPGTPVALQSVPYQRAVAHIKRIGDFGQAYYGRLARRNGFDDALLTGPGGVVSEGASTNIGFFDGDGVLWPEPPVLLGTTMRLLEPRLAGSGLPSRRGQVRLADLPSFGGVFVTNSRGIAAVGRIDDLPLPVNDGLMTALAQAYESVPWEPI